MVYIFGSIELGHDVNLRTLLVAAYSWVLLILCRHTLNEMMFSANQVPIGIQSPPGNGNGTQILTMRFRGDGFHPNHYLRIRRLDA